MEIEITKVETRLKTTKGPKSRRRLYPTANLIGSGVQDVVVIIFEGLKALPVKIPYRGGACLPFYRWS